MRIAEIKDFADHVRWNWRELFSAITHNIFKMSTIGLGIMGCLYFPPLIWKPESLWFFAHIGLFWLSVGAIIHTARNS